MRARRMVGSSPARIPGPPCYSGGLLQHRPIWAGPKTPRATRHVCRRRLQPISCCPNPPGMRKNVPRKKQPPVDATAARTVGKLLRSLRRSAGFKAVRQAAARPECPAALQTIYAYERAGLVPSLPQFLELVEFYALRVPDRPPEIRYEATA